MFFCIILFLSFLIFASCDKIISVDREKQQAIERLRAEQASIHYEIDKAYNDSVWKLMDESGRFTDLREKENEIIDGKYASSHKMNHCIAINNVTDVAFLRLNKLTNIYRGRSIDSIDSDSLNLLLKSILFYARMEIERNDKAPGRFHASCFAIPRNALTVYFSLLPLMDSVEDGTCDDVLAKQVRNKLVTVGFQSWTQPLRNDSTDNNVISVERFRKHVWWVGGNALDYRPLLEAALAMKSVPMIDVLSEVVYKSFSVVSQTTYDDAFWTEGMTADGAGWGHGKQCLVWGYPIDGLKGAFKILKSLRGTPWAETLTPEAVEVVMNYIRGSAFYHCKGIIPPVLDRGNMIRSKNCKGNIPSVSIASILLKDWRNALTENQVEELEQFVSESGKFDIQMSDYPSGNYHGVRYFYNNDDVIKKTKDYYIFVNMASYRVDGLESAYPGAAGFNFYSADGVTLFQSSGDEYRNILGAMKLTSWSGVTTRQTPVKLNPIENWRGYTSLYDFAAGATDGVNDFAAGFVYQKINANTKSNPDSLGTKDINKTIFGVKANKGYFMFDDMFVALGAGITNLQPELEGNITTTIDQTLSKMPPEGWIDGRKVVKTWNESEGTGNTWIRHGKFSYFVVPEQTDGIVRVTREVKTTDWRKLCKVNTEPETDVPVLLIEIDHGKDVVDGKYAYMVSCGNDIPLTLPRILTNTTSLQVVESADGNKIGIVSYDMNEKEITSSIGKFNIGIKAALLIQKLENGKVRISITDAVMDKINDTMRIMTTVPLKGSGVKKVSDGWYEISFKMPVEPERGKPVSLVFELL